MKSHHLWRESSLFGFNYTLPLGGYPTLARSVIYSDQVMYVGVKDRNTPIERFMILDAFAEVWDPAMFKFSKLDSSAVVDRASVNDLAFCPGGKYLVSANQDYYDPVSRN